MTTQLAIAKYNAKYINKTTPLALAIKLACGAAITLSANAMAQQPSANSQNYRIEASPLAKCLNNFAAQSGLLLSADAKLTQGKRCTGITGTLSVEQALLKLLKNTGLQAVKQNDGSYLLAPVSVTNVLATAQVSGLQETATGPVNGYIAKRSSTGTKTDTAIIETPQSISVVSSEFITAIQAESASDVLAYSAGVNNMVGADASVDNFTIRGFSASGSDGSIYRDGLRAQVNVYDGAIEPYGLERLEVLKGPSSLLYGQASPGGIINTVSKRPTIEPLFEVGIALGNQNLRQLTLDFSDTITEDGDWSYRLTVLDRDSEAMTDYIDKNKTYIAPAIRWDISDKSNLTLLASYEKLLTAQIYGLPVIGTVEESVNGKISRNLLTGEPDFTKFDAETKSVSYLFEHHFSEVLTLRNNTRYMETKVKVGQVGLSQFDEISGVASRWAQNRADSTDILATDLNLEYKLKSDRIEQTLLLGLDYTDGYHDSARHRRTISDLNLFNPVYGEPLGEPVVSPRSWAESTKLYSVYLQDQITIDQKWLISLGGRQEWSELIESWLFTDTPKVKTTADAFTGRAGLIYLADNGLAPYFSYSESFQPQTGRDKHNNRFVPTTGQQYEAGLRYQATSSNTLITASIYELTQQNVLTQDPTDEEFEVQTGEVRSRGFELEAKTSIGDNTNLLLAYSYIDARTTQSNVVDEIDERQRGIPYNQLSLWTDYNFTNLQLAGLSVGAGVKYVGSSTGPSAEILVPAYTTVDAMISYQYIDWIFKLNANNLFDKTYVAVCTWGCFYGEERRVNASVKYNF